MIILAQAYAVGAVLFELFLLVLVYGFRFDTRPTLCGDLKAFLLSALIWPLSLIAVCFALNDSLRRR